MHDDDSSPVPPERGADPGDDGPGAATEPAGDAGTGGGRRSRVASPAVAIGVAVALLAGAGAVAYATLGGSDCPPEGAVVQVRGRVVTEEEYNRRIELLGALYGVKPPDDDPEQADAFTRDAAKAIAMAAVVDAEVEERDLRAAQKAVQDALDRFITERFPEGGRSRFIAALGNEGVSEADVVDEFRRLLETNRLFREVIASVEVTDEDVRQAFEERQEKLAVPERRRLRHLVVQTEEEANAALARVRRGEAFRAVASDVSLDASTKAEGGELGFLSAAELEPAFAQAAFSAPTGEPFGPVKTDLGWHVGMVEEVTPGRAVTFEEVRDSLRDQLLGERRLARWRAFLAREIKEADACYAPRYRPEDPDAPPPDMTPGFQP